jgi:hypothetical protein
MLIGRLRAPKSTVRHFTQTGGLRECEVCQLYAG